MSIIFDDDVLVHIIGVPGLDGDGFTAPEAATMRADMDTVLARPVVNELDDIPDVDAPAPGDGNGLVFDSTSGKWKAGDIGEPVHAQSGGTSGMFGPVALFDFGSGIEVSQHPTYPYLALVKPVYGFSAGTISQGNHVHAIRPDVPFPFAASGTLSGGTRPLVSGTVTGLDPDRTYIMKGTLYVHMRGDGAGASFTRPRITINGVGKDIFEDSRIVAGVLITEIAPHTGEIITGATSVAVSASVSFQPGDPAYIGGGVLMIEIESNR